MLDFDEIYFIIKNRDMVDKIFFIFDEKEKEMIKKNKIVEIVVKYYKEMIEIL